MRRLFVLTICMALFAALALPASASSGTGPPPIPTCHPGVGPCQETDHFGELVFYGSPLGCGALNEWAFIQQTGNGVQHINVNKAQDSWFTSTMVGPATHSSSSSRVAMIRVIWARTAMTYSSAFQD